MRCERGKALGVIIVAVKNSRIFYEKKEDRKYFAGMLSKKELILRVLCVELHFSNLLLPQKFSHEVFFCISIEEFKNIFTLLQKLDFWHCHTIHFCKHAVKYSPFFRSNLHSNNSLQLAISEREREKNGKEMKKLH